MSWPVLAFAMVLAGDRRGRARDSHGVARDRRRSARHARRRRRGQAGSRRVSALGRAIVAAQLAITVVLLVGAALLGRSLMRVLSVDPGFRTDDILAMDVSLPSPPIRRRRRGFAAFYARLFGRLRAIPGVEDVAAASAVPMDGGLPDGMFAVMTPQEMPRNGRHAAPVPTRRSASGTADFCAASPAYFHALGIPLVRGRLFDERDHSPAARRRHQRSLARARWPGEDPIGRTIEFGNMDGDLRLLTIVGIVGDTHEYGLEQPPRPTVYVDLLQRPRFETTVVMRSRCDPAPYLGRARRAARGPRRAAAFRTFAPDLRGVARRAAFQSHAGRRLRWHGADPRVAGIYGVMAYTSRAAGGDRRTDRARRDRARSCCAILGQGLSTTLGHRGRRGRRARPTRWRQSLLFGVTPTDPLAFAAVVLLLAAVAALACYVPARRATRVDPVETLRQE